MFFRLEKMTSLVEGKLWIKIKIIIIKDTLLDYNVWCMV